MKKIAIATDSNSGITQKEAQENGIFVIPMPFMIGETDYFEDINLSQKEFYEKLTEGVDVFTSQPSVGSLTEFWEELLKEYDEIIYIPMSSSLSKSCESAQLFAKDYNDRVVVVDNQRISVTQKASIYDALEMAKNGKSAKEIKELLEKHKTDSSIYIMVNTLKYLKKGGRVTAAGAAIGTLLNIKPILQIQGGKLDAYAKVMSAKLASGVLLKAMKKDFEIRFADCIDDMKLFIAYTNNEETALKFKEEVEKTFPNIPIEYCDPLSLSVSCHIGPGALAIAAHRTIK